MNIKEELHTLIDQPGGDRAAVALSHLRERFDGTDSFDDVPDDDWSENESVDQFTAEVQE